MPQESTPEVQRTLYTGFLEEFVVDRVYTTPKIELAQPEGGFKHLEDISGRNYRFVVVGGLKDALSAHVHFEDEKEPKEADVWLYKLWPSKRANLSTTEKEANLHQEFTQWLQGRVFVTPEILGNREGNPEETYVRAELSGRPYRFDSLGNSVTSTGVHITFLDRKEPHEIDLLLCKLWGSLEIPPEEVARRMKKE